MEDSDSDDPDMPDLQDVSDSESDDEGSVWFTNIEDEVESSSWESEELSGVDWSETSSFVNVDPDSEAAEPDELAAQVEASNCDIPQAEIYDSGCSKHLTPYRNALEKFVNISPKSLRAANKQNINAVGMGEMVIDVPNGADVSQL